MQAEKMSMISTFLTGAAHELKNPLFVISGWAQMMKRKGDLNNEQLKCMDYIMDGTYRCIGIVENLLNLTRNNVVESKNLDLNAVVRSAVEKIRNTLEERRLELTLDLSSYAKMTGSVSEMEQVVSHLISNAADAVAGRAKGRIKVRTQETEAICLLEVRDNGAGMTPEVQQKLFDPFFTTKDVGQGTGLGMTIVKRIIDNHRGKINVESRPGEGTSITISFPRTGAGDGA